MKLQQLHIGIASLIAIVAAGCSPAFTDEQRATVVPVIFEVLIASPSDYEGKTVMFAGEIIATTNRDKETEIEILQKPLDSQRRPQNTDVSHGRFLFVAPRYLDPAVYSAGRKITVIGVFRGMTTRKLGEADFKYPVLDEVSHHLWKPTELGPKVRVGVGVSVPIR